MSSRFIIGGKRPRPKDPDSRENKDSIAKECVGSVLRSHLYLPVFEGLRTIALKLNPFPKDSLGAPLPHYETNGFGDIWRKR